MFGLKKVLLSSAIAAGVVAIGGFAQSANAQVYTPGYAPVRVVAPVRAYAAPVYVYPPAYVVAQPQVVVAPPPVVYAPAPVYARPVFVAPPPVYSPFFGFSVHGGGHGHSQWGVSFGW